uniref:Uncharacterized protein n=1 Tax=Arundo donax TaxID=35708 RepID=A0A0A8ZJ70_ARUDO
MIRFIFVILLLWPLMIIKQARVIKHDSSCD